MVNSKEQNFIEFGTLGDDMLQSWHENQLSIYQLLSHVPEIGSSDDDLDKKKCRSGRATIDIITTLDFTDIVQEIQALHYLLLTDGGETNGGDPEIYEEV